MNNQQFSSLFLFIRLWLVVWLQKHAYIENRGSEFLVENAMLTIEEMWHKNNNPFSILSFFHKFYFSKHQHKGRTMVDLIRYWCIEMFHLDEFTIITRLNFQFLLILNRIIDDFCNYSYSFSLLGLPILEIFVTAFYTLRKK